MKGLASARMRMLMSWDIALEARLNCVDHMLPAPWLFGRRRWRQTRDIARNILSNDHARVWVRLVDADSVDELIAAVEPTGPDEAAKRAVEEAKRCLAERAA